MQYAGLDQSRDAEPRSDRDSRQADPEAMRRARSISAAVGLLAGQLLCTIDEAYALLRNESRSQRAGMDAVANALIAQHHEMLGQQRRAVQPDLPRVNARLSA